MTDQGEVLVTGGSGYIGSWCIARLLNDGWRVRTTIRNLAREAEVRRALATVAPAQDRLSSSPRISSATRVGPPPRGVAAICSMSPRHSESKIRATPMCWFAPRATGPYARSAPPSRQESSAW